jgi:uncharacterized membrane protein YedE/YeeE
MMARAVAALVSGLLFGFGLALSEMVNPARVLGFLDVAGRWDPSLALVLVAAAGVALIGYRLALMASKPALAETFVLPEKTTIDARLVIGAALLGIGWGLAGLCPGPGFASLVFGHMQSLFFLATMGAGLYMARQLN